MDKSPKDKEKQLQSMSPQNRKCIAYIVACLVDHPSRDSSLQPSPSSSSPQPPSEEATSCSSNAGPSHTPVQPPSWEHMFCAELCKHFSLSEQDTRAILEVVPLSNCDPGPFKETLLTQARGREANTFFSEIVLLILNFSIAKLHSYDARVRVLLRRMSLLFGLDWKWLVEQENAYSHQLLVTMAEVTANKQKHSKSHDVKKWLKVGAFAAVGGGLIALTAGLAAPAVGALLLVLTGSGAVAAFFASAAGAAIVMSLFGLGGGGLMGLKLEHRLGSLKEFKFVSLSQQITLDKARQLRRARSGLLGDSPEHSTPPSPRTPRTPASSSESIPRLRSSTSRASLPPPRYPPSPSSRSSPRIATTPSNAMLPDTNARLSSSTPVVSASSDSWSPSPCPSPSPAAAAPLSYSSSAHNLQKLAAEKKDREAESMKDKRMSEAKKKQQQPQLSSENEPDKETKQDRPSSTNQLAGKADQSELDEQPEPLMHAVLAVPGWLKKKHEAYMWEALQNLSPADNYLLLWESKDLKALGTALHKMVTNAVKNELVKRGVALTVFAGVWAAIAWPSTLLSIGDLVDNPWSVAMARAEHAGKLLASVLAERAHGRRPITLVGFSMGARLIFNALLELDRMECEREQRLRDNEQKEKEKEKEAAKEKEREKPRWGGGGTKDSSKKDEEEELKTPAWADGYRGIVEDVYLFGAACDADPKLWRRARRMVAGRLVNGYSSDDWVLRFLFRATELTTKVAGTAAVDVGGVENVNLGSIVPGHTKYRSALQDILDAVSFPSQGK